MKPRGVTWKGAGGCVIASQARQVNFSRTVWITFQDRGTTSSVSVTSPSFDSFTEPQHGQLVGAGTTTRSRGRCSGKGLRTGWRRKVGAGSDAWRAVASAAISSSVAAASSSASWSSIWSINRAVRSERRP
jgi:hypothetical protein